MNYRLYIVLGWINFQILAAQNLVPNPGFEEYYDCPSFLGSVKSFNMNTQWGILKDWQANPPYCTPDYYNECGKRDFRTPKNLCGEMPTIEGKAYVGMIVRIGEVHIGNMEDIFYREHITAQLIEPLKVNFQYLVKMNFVLSEYSNYASANIGVLFTEKPLVIQENKIFLPQVSTPFGKVISEKARWVVLIDTFLAKGGEKFITIGNFDAYKNRQMRKLTTSQEYFKKFNFNRAYYYFDDISVTEIGEIPQDTTSIPTLDTELGKLIVNQPIILKNIYFEFDKADLLPASFNELDKLLKTLKKYPQAAIEIRGHTDSIGTNTKNQNLSENRARSVVNYLIEQGINPLRLSAQGFGESQPIDSNGTDSGRQNNRRVEFVIRLRKE